MSPDQGDVWFLRLLLLHRPANSWIHVRTVNNIFDTNELTARALGLVHDADEYVQCLQEAARFSTAKDLRQPFTTLILTGAPATPLWEYFQNDISGYFAMIMTPDASFNATLKHIDLMLNKYSRSTEQLGLPKVTHDNSEYDRLLWAFDIPQRTQLAATLMQQLTTEQNCVFKTD